MVKKAMVALSVIAALGIVVGCKDNASGNSGTPGAPGAVKQPDQSSPDWDPSGGKKVAEGEAIKIGFVVKQPEEQWFRDEWKYAGDAAKKYGFELLTREGQDATKVEKAITSLASVGAQGFIICTPDVKLGQSILQLAKKYKLKLFSVDDQLVDADGNPLPVHHMGISSTEIGKAMGKAIDEEMKKRKWDPKEVGLFVPTWKQLPTASERTEGAKAALKEAGFPEAQMFEVAQKTTDVQGGYNACNIAITQHPEVKKWLVCGMNDEAVLGAVRALEGHKFYADTVIGVGIGGTQTSIDEFEKAQATGFFGTIKISPKRHGYETAEMMYKWIKDGVEPPKTTFTTGTLMTRADFKAKMKE